MKTTRICAIIVTYEPDITQLRILLENLRGQVEQAVIVDNSPVSLAFEEIASTAVPVKVVRNRPNAGIGRAHNQGITLASTQGFSHVLLLDQDSLPETDMVRKLVLLDQKMLAEGIRTAAVGPMVLDAQTSAPHPVFLAGRWWIDEQFCREVSYCRVLYLITSGTLIRLQTIRQVGLFSEDLFIDLVDVEWGLRVGQKGFSLVVGCDARLRHSIGSRKSVGPGITMTSHIPERLYYQFRNYLYLVRAYFPASSGWFLYHGLRRLLPKFFLFLLVPPRFNNLRMMVWGIRDGLSGSWPRTRGSGAAIEQKSGPLE